MSHSMPIPAFVTTTYLVPVIVFSVLATAAIALRIYALRLVDSSIRGHADLWLIIIGLMFCWGDTIQMICSAAIQGLNVSHQSPTEYARFNYKIQLSNVIINTLSSAFIKLSILQFYKHIFDAQVQFNWTANALQALVALWGLSGFITPLLTLDPNVHYPPGPFTLGLSGAGIGLDFLTLCLPIPIIWRLHMSTEKKLKVIAILWLGAFCVICACLRFYFIYNPRKLPAAQSFARLQEADFWSRLEPLASIIAACLPTYGPLARSRPIERIIRSVNSLRSLRSWDPRSTDRKDSHGSGSNITRVPDLGHHGKAYYSAEAQATELSSERLSSFRSATKQERGLGSAGDRGDFGISVQREVRQTSE